MTEISWPWGCDPTGDGGPLSLTVEKLVDTNMFTSNFDPANDAVIRWTRSPYNGHLNANPPMIGNIVSIDSGVGIVEGWLYKSDDSTAFDVSGGNANATDLIVLRRSNPGSAPQIVRLAHLRGPAGGTATVTQTASVFEVALWEVELTAAGNYSALNDVRGYINAEWKTAFVQAQTGRNTTDAVDAARTMHYYGVQLMNNKSWQINAGWQVPKDFISDLSVQAILILSGGGSGNTVATANFRYGQCGEAGNNHYVTVPQATIAVTDNQINCIQNTLLPNAATDDFFSFRFTRIGVHASDTAPLYYLTGWEFRYLGYKR